jgi:hypothetical protein
VNLNLLKESFALKGCDDLRNHQKVEVMLKVDRALKCLGISGRIDFFRGDV